MYKETNKMANKRMNQLANEFLTLKVNYREVDWLAKYNDAVESQKDAENQVLGIEIDNEAMLLLKPSNHVFCSRLTR